VISQTAEYALRAVVYLAKNAGRSLPVQAIAVETQVPPDYLAKVLQALARRGLVQSRRGLGGGFALARPASRVTVLDVVESVDPVARIRECPLGLPEHARKLCPLHKRLDEAAAMIERSFAASTIDEMVEPDPPRRRRKRRT
jgi:Rrf2 family protein